MYTSSHSPVRSRDRRQSRPTIGQMVGELLLTAAAVLLLFVFYEAFWTNLASARLQEEAAAQLEQRWNSAPASAGEPVVPAAPPLGDAFARLYLPTLGEDAVYAVVEGTRNEDLRTGPGHYPGSQMPGEPGNAALAGHRNGSGAVFEHLDRLNSCDAIIVETETQWQTYRLLPLAADGEDRETALGCLTPSQAQRLIGGDYAHVTGLHITTPDDVDVIAPVPGVAEANDGAASHEPALPPEPLLTLTTCHPLYSNSERLIVHAIMVEALAKTDGYPAALEG